MYKVLIVDDEERIRKGLEKIIDWESLGFSLCVTAENGRSGLGKAKEIRPDLIIADLHMPGIDGIEMIRQVREEGLQSQVIILSGVTDFQYAREAIDLKVATYLLKPINEEELTAKIAQLFPKAQEQLLADTAQDPVAPVVIQEIIQYINQHYHKPIKLNGVASTFHYSAPYLGRIFKQITGETFHDYLENVRMEKAKAFLDQGHKVYVVAKMTGYANVDYFANLFKAYVGITPNDYKRRKLP